MEHKHLMELWFFLGVALEILVTAEIWNSKIATTPGHHLVTPKVRTPTGS
ncbi:hypothetical protein MCOR27_008468 [Pyricularia oryzae]|nr:hypothetical protein MCOR01_009918 [Pyricularia oryzae]KAI6272201.1 hypothetical protein MCOR27_008468 [Pyricularia oryzae]KAI6338603.1 hypothetical protein MCOR28_007817 [Pyricularia oryzae]KAI6372373.1 hypothetical protein MCOR31_003675 [Pyricularia oryzae]KAI6398106.1 hypothetical protein MCOR24_008899 [Pyricularia oryzae]